MLGGSEYEQIIGSLYMAFIRQIILVLLILTKMSKNADNQSFILGSFREKDLTHIFQIL